MPRPVTLLLTLLALVALGAAACEQQEPDVTPEEQVSAENRPEDGGEDGEDGEDADGGGDGGGGEIDGTFVAVDIDWSEAPDTLSAGEVTLQLDNQGDLEHDLTIEELGDEEVIEDVAGGESATATVELDPGEYTIYCDVGAHRQAGMETTVTVE